MISFRSVVPALAVLVLAACATHSSREAAQQANLRPDTSELIRRYDYYPNAQVYHSRFHGRYYWQEDDRWVSGPALPPHVRISEFDRETVELPTTTPYEMHARVAARYPSLETLLDRLGHPSRDGTSGTIATVPTDE